VGLRYLRFGRPDQLVNLWPAAGTGPAWSPDGQRIVYGMGNPNYRAGGAGNSEEQIVVANADGSAAVALTSGKERHLFADWSPDGRKLAYMQDYSLWIMNPDGSDKRQLLAGHDVREMAWSPDGAQIAFEAGNTWPTDPQAPYNQDIWVANADGSGLRNLTNSPGVSDGEPSWSPDGTAIIFSSGDVVHGQYQIMVLKLASGVISHLTNEGTNFSPFWVK